MNQLTSLLATLMALTIVGCAGADSATARSGAADRLLASIIERDGGPGVMAAVVRDGELLWSGAQGAADLEFGVPISNRTRMRIGSVSKPITAALLLRLRDRGLIDLDADIRELVPELAANQAGTITARSLAAHTSGIRQYDFANFLDANNVFYHATLTEAFAKVADDPLLHEPGTKIHYSSLGYNALGLAAERASNMSFPDVIARELSAPLGLRDTMIDHPLDVIANRTRFYTKFPDGIVRNTIWRDSSDYYPSGGMLSTAEDLAKLTSALFGGEWLSPASMALLTTEATTSNGDPVGYTFGWQIVRADDGSVKYYEHGGETNGAYAFVRYYPDERLTISGIANTNFAQGEPYFFAALSDDLPALFDVEIR